MYRMVEPNWILNWFYVYVYVLVTWESSKLWKHCHCYLILSPRSLHNIGVGVESVYNSLSLQLQTRLKLRKWPPHRKHPLYTLLHAKAVIQHHPQWYTTVRHCSYLFQFQTSSTPLLGVPITLERLCLRMTTKLLRLLESPAHPWTTWFEIASWLIWMSSTVVARQRRFLKELGGLMQFLRSASYHSSTPRFSHSGRILWSDARVMRNMLLRCAL